MTHSVGFMSTMDVKLVSPEAAARDASVVFAARVSTRGDNAKPETLHDKEIGLIRFLMRERHGTPFEHNLMTFYVHAPIFVMREMMRHRIASYNEESGRYRELEPVFYVPPIERNIVQIGKPGAYTFVPGTYYQQRVVDGDIRRMCSEAYSAYQNMLSEGVAREVARMVLPVTIYSSAYVSMNARALMNFLSLRTSSPDAKVQSYPMAEIEQVASKMEDIFTSLMPTTHKAFVDEGRISP